MPNTIHPRKIRARRKLLLLLALSVILLGSACAVWIWWQDRQQWVSTNDAYVTGHLVNLKALTSGVVVEVLAENTQAVRKGQVLVRLDGVAAKLVLDQAKAELAEAVRRISAQFKQIEVLKQRIGVAEAALARIQHDRARYRQAAKEGGASAQQLQNAEDQIRETEAGIRQVRAEIDALQSQVRGTTPATHPSVVKAKEALRRAYLEYVRKDILAPVSGYIAKRRVQIGEQLAPGAPLLAIVPLDQLWVEANVKETQLARIRPGQPAEIRADSLGSEFVYRGVVEGISPGTGSVFSLLPPEYAAGNYIHVVERVPVRVALAADDLAAHPLRPGLSTLTRIGISAPGDSVLQSKVRLGGSAYRTDTYDSELKDVGALIEAVVSENLQHP